MGSPREATERNEVEERVDAALTRSDWRAATTLILQHYGPEVLGFLSSLHRDGTAEEVFSMFAEAVWRSVRTFERRSSARTWAYAIARRVSLHHRREARRRDRYVRPFEDDAELAEVEARVRTETLSFLRTETRSKLAALRDELPPDDQTLLMLRVDRKLAWTELAIVLRASEEPPEGADLKREAARLRKRFQLVKERLREAAKAAGLLDIEDA